LKRKREEVRWQKVNGGKILKNSEQKFCRLGGFLLVFGRRKNTKKGKVKRSFRFCREKEKRKGEKLKKRQKGRKVKKRAEGKEGDWTFTVHHPLPSAGSVSALLLPAPIFTPLHCDGRLRFCFNPATLEFNTGTRRKAL